MPRFVILVHDFPALHWDLLLETSAALRAWRLLRPPDSPGPITAEPLPDHRTLYLEYEGPVSGGRGTVTRWDAGEYRIVGETPELLTVDLAGGKLNARYRLEHSEERTQFVRI